MTPPRETAERIVRNQEAVCLGCSDPIAPWCSTQRPGTPLCRPCQALADAIAEALATETAQREAAERQSREDTARYRDEYAIVDRVWKALGVTEYDNGLAIDERVSALRAALTEMTDVWKVEAQQKLDLITEKDKLAWALTEAQRERDDAAARAFDNEMLGRVTMGRVMALEAERDRLTAALTEAQRQRDAARVVAIRQADACRALRQGASPSYVHGVGTCREDAIPRERWCLYCDLAEALNL